MPNKLTFAARNTQTQAQTQTHTEAHTQRQAHTQAQPDWALKALEGVKRRLQISWLLSAATYAYCARRR